MYIIIIFDINNWLNVTGITIKSSLSLLKYSVFIMLPTAKMNDIAWVAIKTKVINDGLTFINKRKKIFLNIKNITRIIATVSTKYLKKNLKNDLKSFFLKISYLLSNWSLNNSNIWDILFPNYLFLFYYFSFDFVLFFLNFLNHAFLDRSLYLHLN